MYITTETIDINDTVMKACKVQDYGVIRACTFLWYQNFENLNDFITKL